jgi:phosphoribosylaminoimidazole-succinocarboxamide synthase
MPDIYAKGDFDIAGFAVGVVELDRAIDPSRVEPDDIIIGLPASGVHSNGFTLARAAVADLDLKKISLTEISNLTSEEFDSIMNIAIEVDKIIESEAGKRGLIHVDGKKEFALGKNRVPVLVDSFGTLDEDRWWDSEKYDEGEIVQLSKEFVRSYYLGTGHHEKLYQARTNDSEEPPIPALPQEVIDQTAELYSTMFTRLTGQEF